MPAMRPRSCCIRRHRPLLLLLIAYAAVVFPLAAVYGRFPGDVRVAGASLIFTIIFSLLGLIIALLLAARRDRDNPRAAIAAWWNGWWTEHGPGVLVAVAYLPALLTVFLMGKLLIPDINPFGWDARFAEIDRLLHGTEPWRLLQPLLGVPALTNAVSLVYSCWFILMFGAWVIWALSEHPQRMRFLISYALCWILLGTFAATLLSSAGPVFYADVTGEPEGFGDLVAYLRDVDRQHPLVSLRIRDRLWEAYVTGTASGGSGISAMPSLHVAIVTLCVISSWYVSWRAGIAMTLYAVVIVAGSVHLGWHYAVDGYVAIVAVALIWYGVGKFLARHERAARIPAGAAVSS